jgi:hypothetical protein
MQSLETKRARRGCSLERAHNNTPVVNEVVEPAGIVVKQTVAAEEGAA